MQSENIGHFTIVGGSYQEVNGLQETKELFGSGLRALALFQEMDAGQEIDFYSCCGKNASLIRGRYYRAYTHFHLQEAADVSFYYEHPFRVSDIHPRPDVLYKNKQTIEAEGENVLVFGMIDADFHVKGKNVVYDPQTSALPQSFVETGSEAGRLVLILNGRESVVMSGGLSGLEERRNFFFEKEHCFALIIKDGSKGAWLFQDKDDPGTPIPVYMTERVYSIGSGDIFTAYFAWQWMNGQTVEEAAQAASRAVACYANTGKVKEVRPLMEQFPFHPLQCRNNGQVYLAGPFFSYTQRWLVNEFYKALLSEGIKVFSPLHDVGIGDADEVTDADVEGLEESAVVLAIVDGLDSGTLFEIGYAVARGKKVIAYVQNESRKSLQMLEGTHCDIVDDFTTAVYRASWYAMQ